jgi:hypothetical protein
MQFTAGHFSAELLMGAVFGSGRTFNQTGIYPALH